METAGTTSQSVLFEGRQDPVSDPSSSPLRVDVNRQDFFTPNNAEAHNLGAGLGDKFVLAFLLVGCLSTLERPWSDPCLDLARRIVVEAEFPNRSLMHLANRGGIIRHGDSDGDLHRIALHALPLFGTLDVSNSRFLRFAQRVDTDAFSGSLGALDTWADLSVMYQL